LPDGPQHSLHKHFAIPVLQVQEATIGFTKINNESEPQTQTKSEDDVVEPQTQSEDVIEPPTKSEDDIEPPTKSEDDSEPLMKSEDDIWYSSNYVPQWRRQWRIVWAVVTKDWHDREVTVQSRANADPR